ncbi:hypothetical protein VP01_1639g9 [Puccinia sorghi]|uniref:Uncharacterized protein n=1 Tax=Puccinia sorghi TaxID=27349 RepID=A0A0L6VHB2_9BASI|nr:hypothetical protein VP01_1639g9 [Puccinia sorghi]
MESYTQPFNIHTYNSSWSNDILVSLYRGGLKKNIRLAIVSSGKAFPSRIFPCNSATNLKPTTATLSKSAHQHSTTATNPNAMDLFAMKSRLSDSEHVKMMQAGQCF